MLKTKKGFFSTLAGIFFAVVFAFVLVGCGENGDLGEGEVTQEQWNAALGAENLENVTITLSGTVERNFDGESQTVQETTTIKFADGKMQVTIIDDGTQVADEVFANENVEENKTAYLRILTALLKQREKFTFDDSDKTYKLDETVTTTISFSDDLLFTVTMTNSSVRFDEGGKPVCFQCDYTQTGHGVNIKTNASWTFKDYGATTITKAVTQD